MAFMKTPRASLLCLIPLLLTASDVWAWGLYTHVWFAQALLWLIPLADPRFRAAAQKLPRLVLAGACLPDLALVAGLAGAHKQRFSDTHEWSLAAEQLARADTDEARALALGFASHLLTDIFAHNHFVPAHERTWGHVPVLTHASCEWALDHHVRQEIFFTPGQLLAGEEHHIAAYLQAAFDCPRAQGASLLRTLRRAEKLLRVSQLPALAHGVGALRDARMQSRFRHYLAQTVQRLPEINALIAGERPVWEANPRGDLAHAAVSGMDLSRLKRRLQLPETVFVRR